MNLSEHAQELLEQLWMVGEESAAASPVTGDPASPGADELLRWRLAEQADGALTLTQAGRPEAARAIRRHRLAERLVNDVLAMGAEQMDSQACRLEHVLVEGLDESICTLLGHPKLCPHGKPIPPGRCCEQGRATVGRLVAPLSDLQTDQSGQIAYIQTDKADHTQKLMAMGVLPGVAIRLIQRWPSFVFEAGFSQFAVDEEMAGDIYVRCAQ